TPLIMRASRAPYRVGVGGGRGDRVYNVRVRPFARNDMEQHYIDQSAQLAVPFGVDAGAFDWRPELFLNEIEVSWGNAQWGQAIEGRLLVNLSASEKKRRWPDDRFITVIRKAQEIRPGVTVRVIALPAEEESARKVAEAVGGVAVLTPSLRNAFAIVNTAD